MAKNTTSKDSGHVAIARALNLPVSTKQCVEICRSLRYKDISYAKKFIEEVSLLKRAVPYKRSTMNIAHKAGMSAGRYPQKAAKEILRLLKSVEANAQAKGLDISNLKITKILANKASIPFSGGRNRGAGKRTHVEVEVREKFAKNKTGSKADKAESKKAETAAKEMPEIKSESKLDAKDETKPFKTEQLESPQKQEAAKPEIRSKPVRAEPSSEELLRRAQQKAAELKKREKEQKETNEVSELYEQLKQKGSLRSAGGKK